MFKQEIGVAVLMAVALPWGVAVVEAADDVDVKVFSVSEHREVQLIETDQSRKFAGSFKILTVTLQLQGKSVESATHFGHITITKATDDKGADLNPSKSNSSFGGQNSYNDINRKQMWFFEENPPKDKIKVDLMLSQPARPATKIATLEGTLKLKSATLKDVMVSGLGEQVGKAVADPTLTASGATVTITKFDPKSNSFEMKITDPNDRVTDYDIVDAGGKTVSNGHSSFGFNNAKTVSMDCTSLPASAKLKLSVATSTTEKTVPFKVANVTLP